MTQVENKEVIKYDKGNLYSYCSDKTMRAYKERENAKEHKMKNGIISTFK